MNKTEKVLKYLKKGKSISDKKAAKLCDSYRLSGIIYELRHRYGLNVQDRWVESKNARYKEYYLVEED